MDEANPNRMNSTLYSMGITKNSFGRTVSVGISAANMTQKSREFNNKIREAE